MRAGHCSRGGIGKGAHTEASFRRLGLRDMLEHWTRPMRACNAHAARELVRNVEHAGWDGIDRMGAKRLAAEAGDWEAPAPFDVPLLPRASAFLIESKLYRLRVLDGPCASSSWFDHGGIVAADAKDAFAPSKVSPSPSLGGELGSFNSEGEGGSIEGAKHEGTLRQKWSAVKQRPIPIGMKAAEMFNSGLSGSPVFVNSISTDQSELAMSLGASPYRHSFEWRMGKSPGGKGRWS